MSVRAMPGSVPRNGMPAPGGCQYSGAGYDQLSPQRSLSGMRRQKNPPRIAREAEPDGRCPECSYLLTSAGHRLECGES